MHRFGSVLRRVHGQRARYGLSLFLGLTATALSGCGGGADGPELQQVHGQVQFDGQPVENGRILFRMEAGDQKSYSAEIVNGSYELDAEAGSAIVEITATRDTGKTDDQGGAAEPVPIVEMYIPAEYNSASTLKKDVAAGENEISFDLKPM